MRDGGLFYDVQSHRRGMSLQLCRTGQILLHECSRPQGA